jgi:hypothetical protein
MRLQSINQMPREAICAVYDDSMLKLQDGFTWCQSTSAGVAGTTRH